MTTPIIFKTPVEPSPNDGNHTYCASLKRLADGLYFDMTGQGYTSAPDDGALLLLARQMDWVLPSNTQGINGFDLLPALSVSAASFTTLTRITSAITYFPAFNAALTYYPGDTVSYTTGGNTTNYIYRAKSAVPAGGTSPSISFADVVSDSVLYVVKVKDGSNNPLAGGYLSTPNGLVSLYDQSKTVIGSLNISYSANASIVVDTVNNDTYMASPTTEPSHSIHQIDIIPNLTSTTKNAVTAATFPTLTVVWSTTYQKETVTKTALDIVNDVQDRAGITVGNASTFSNNRDDKLILKYINDTIEDINDNHFLDAMTARGFFLTAPGVTVYEMCVPNRIGISAIKEFRAENGLKIKPMTDYEFSQQKLQGTQVPSPIASYFTGYRIIGRYGDTIAIELLSSPTQATKINFEILLRAQKLSLPTDVSPIDSEILMWGALYRFRQSQGEDFQFDINTFASKIASKTFKEDSNATEMVV